MVCEWYLRMKLHNAVVCLCLSLPRIAKGVAELGQLPPREILSILHHPLPHSPHLSTCMVHAIHSIPSQGSILPNALVCELAWSNAIPHRDGSANPSCTTKRAHKYHTRPNVCARGRPLLNSRHTHTRLTFPRKEEERRGEGPLPSESRNLLSHATSTYAESCGLARANVG